MVLHKNGAGNIFAQASIANLFIPERMLESIPLVISWKAAVHLGRVSSLDYGRNALGKRNQRRWIGEGRGGVSHRMAPGWELPH